MQLCEVTDQKLLEATKQQVFHFLVATLTNLGHQDLALESSLYPEVNVSGFLPVTVNFDISGWLVLDETLGLLLDDLGLHKVFGSSHDAGLEMDATSSEPFIMGS